MLAAGCARHSDLVIGDTPDSDLARMVDSDAARQMLTELLARRPRCPIAAARRLTRSSPASASRVNRSRSRGPRQARLRENRREVSMDFGALVFAKGARCRPKSQAVQAPSIAFSARAGPLIGGATAAARLSVHARLRPVVASQEPSETGSTSRSSGDRDPARDREQADRVRRERFRRGQTPRSSRTRSAPIGCSSGPSSRQRE